MSLTPVAFRVSTPNPAVAPTNMRPAVRQLERYHDDFVRAGTNLSAEQPRGLLRYSQRPTVRPSPANFAPTNCPAGVPSFIGRKRTVTSSPGLNCP